MSKTRPSRRAASFTESVIREMTRLAMEHDAINLAQGFPDFATPEEIKRAAQDAVAADLNQYPITWGEPELREAIAAKYEQTYGMAVDPDRNVCVTCGSTEAMISSILGILDPSDEMILFEPFYENYGPDAILAGATPRFVPLREPDWTIDEAELRAAFTDRTRGIVINTPNNPTGKVFSREELTIIAELCQRYDVVAFTDEIYEHITYDGAVHVPLATIPGMEDRTVTISALSKTYAVTGWRVGWAIAPETLTIGIRTVHDFLTVGAPTPLQHAGAAALALPDAYYDQIAREYA
ncbi:MAG TPA: aminotransferase class I/II-fold pyridoxal phosphate-dependent enzyme, partial [Actinomycetota bacterium]|nr:aminotransferase class I/II-fold pyridoxal phosphate-dependent enzyme [Actinomycetota bacterium]